MDWEMSSGWWVVPDDDDDVDETIWEWS